MLTDYEIQSLKSSFTGDNKTENKMITRPNESKTVQDRASLIDTTPLIERTSRNSLRDSILIKTMSFGLNGFFFSAYIVTNSKLLAMLGDEESAAGALGNPPL